MRAAIGLTLSVLLISCNGGGPPDPEPTPTATPWECGLGYPGCHEYEPPLQCSSEEAPCWHNPTGQPEHCEEAPKCDVPELPQPQCETFTDRGGALRTLDEACDCYFGQVWVSCPTGECIDESKLIPAHCPGPDHRQDVKNATMALGDLTGGDPQENLKLLAETIHRQTGRCVIGGIEAVFIVRDDGLAEENHAVYFGDGGWTGSGFGKYIGCHSGVAPFRCGEPDPLGLPGEMKLKKHHQNWDSTYLVYRQYEYCVAAGFVNRASCPVRLEGNYEREACEHRVGLGPGQKWWCDGQPIESLPHNTAQAHCIGHVKTCTEDEATCGEATW